MKSQNASKFPGIYEVLSFLEKRSPFLTAAFDNQFREFGVSWLEDFEKDLDLFFCGDSYRLSKAAEGYSKFALDSMLLQKRFDRSGRYEPKSYAQASAEVYQNAEYMETLYLPGIHLSHFLWRHHYLQLKFFRSKFMPIVREHGGSSYIDIGTGTGFYLREMLRHGSELSAVGYDLSPSSISYSRLMLQAFGLENRADLRLEDVLQNVPPAQVSFLTSVEVLEHLEDPPKFLRGLCGLLEPGGLGMITAAVTAPNADHIYLYMSAQEVANQVEEAGFVVLETVEDYAYEPRKVGDSVPRNAIVIVSK